MQINQPSQSRKVFYLCLFYQKTLSYSLIMDQHENIEITHRRNRCPDVALAKVSGMSTLQTHVSAMRTMRMFFEFQNSAQNGTMPARTLGFDRPIARTKPNAIKR